MKRRGVKAGISNWLMAGGFVLLSTSCFPGGGEALFLDGVELEAAGSCSALEAGLRERSIDQAELRAFAAVTGGLFNPGGFNEEGSRNHSETNNQEAGVNEADILKVDGRFAYAIHNGSFIVVEANGEGVGENFSVTSAKLVSELEIAGEPFEMFVKDNRALVLAHTNQREVKELFNTKAPARPGDFPVLKAVVVDISDRSAPKTLREVIFEGEYLSARRIEGRAYLVLKAAIKAGFDEDEDVADQNWLTRRKAEIASSSIDGWLPSYYDVQHRPSGARVAEVKRCSCRNTFQSDATAGDSTVTVYSLDMEGEGSDVTNTTVVGDGAHIYASKKNLVVALTGYAQSRSNFNVDEDEDSAGKSQATFLHRFALDTSGKATYSASGRVDGWVLNQFSMSEHEGVLRVATQTGERLTGEGESHIFALRLAAKDEFMSVGGDKSRYLKVIGQLRGIGAGEDMYAARFVGDRGYLVTFQETDPLWNIDLSDPTQPEIDGDLEVPGYSTYLHPIEGKRLLAVGRMGSNRGLKVSLFDVGRANPGVIDEEEVGDGESDSEALTDHRAFRFLPDHKIMAVPMVHRRANGLQLYTVGSELRYAGRISHKEMGQGGDVTVRRSQLIGHHLVALSGVGISITDMNTRETVALVDLEDE